MRLKLSEIFSVVPIIIIVSIVFSLHRLSATGLLCLLLNQGGYACIVIGKAISDRKSHVLAVKAWVGAGLLLFLLWIILFSAGWMLSSFR
jgi:hypothetical protein